MPMASQPLRIWQRLSCAGLHVAIDGKTLRGTHDAELGRHRVHLLRFWVDAHSMSAGQVVCEEKSNDLEAIPRLLAAVELRGATLTIDAMGTQTAIAAQIHDAGADYVQALKANQKSAMAAVQSAFGDKRKEPIAAGEPTLPSPPQEGAVRVETLELCHGRCERREYQLLGDLSSFDKSWKWQGLQAMGKVRREVQRSHDGPPHLEEHYFLCSFKDDIERFAKLVRSHRSVENRCHWVLDVTFNEDHCQVRDKTAAHNLSMVRELALKSSARSSRQTEPAQKTPPRCARPFFPPQLLGLLHA